MTAQEAAKRNEKAQNLKVWQADNTSFYVESEDGKIAYKCSIADNGDFCSCGDFTQRSKNNPQFACKHLLAVMNAVPRNEVLDAQIMEKRKPKLDERFIKNIDGKEFAIYAGLLDLAHQKNLISLEVELLQYPTKENDHTAICKATAKTATGAIFVDVGDANPINCNSKVSKHLIRMASTRGKARSLRDLTNVGITCLEELGDINEVIGGEVDTIKSSPIRKNNVKQFPAEQVTAIKTATADNEGMISTDQKVINTEAQTAKQSSNDDNQSAKIKPPVTKKAKSNNDTGKSKEQAAPKMSEAQKNAVYNLARRRGISVAEVAEMVIKTFNLSVEDITSADASSFIKQLQQAS